MMLKHILQYHWRRLRSLNISYYLPTGMVSNLPKVPDTCCSDGRVLPEMKLKIGNPWTGCCQSMALCTKFHKNLEALQASWGTQKPMNTMRTSLLSSAAALTRTCSWEEEQGRERMWCTNCICTSYKGVYLFDCTCGTLKREPSEVWGLLDLRVSDM